jgi:hypothetical protein
VLYSNIRLEMLEGNKLPKLLSIRVYTVVFARHTFGAIVLQTRGGCPGYQ